MSGFSLKERIPKLDRAWNALEAGDLESFMALAEEESAPDVEFSSGIGTVVGGRTFQGLEGIREWFSELLTISRDPRWTERRYETFGNEVLVFFARLEFAGASSGAPASSETGAVFQYRDERCFRIDSFMTHREAREFAEAQIA